MSQLLGLFYFKDMPLVYFILTHPTPDFHLKKVSTFNAKSTGKLAVYTCVRM